MALYWGSLYGSVIIFLLAIIKEKKLLKNIIIINLFIAGILAVGLTIFFLVQPDAVKSLTLNFLVCVQRPYEALGGIGAAINTFDMAGTRPTGLGRYAGFVAIFALASFLYAKKSLKAVWFVILIPFLLILLFSKGKTELLAFIVALIFIIWLSKKISLSIILFLGAVLAVSFFIIFYNIPCSNSNIFSDKPVLQNSQPNQKEFSANISSDARNFGEVVTLSGRTNGVWTDAWILFLKNPLTGFGFQSDRFFLNNQHAHNSVLQALIEGGILGTIPFLLAFILLLIILTRLIKDIEGEDKESNFLIIISALLMFFAVRSITESVAYFSADWLFVAPMIAYIQCLNSERKFKNYLNFNGVKISSAKMPEVLNLFSYWIKSENAKSHFVVVTGMHGIVEAYKSQSFRYILNQSDLFVPDGISLVWLAQLKGVDISQRVSGADLMQQFLKMAEKESFSNYFYGDTDETLKDLKNKLSKIYPTLKVSGFFSPPFRNLTEKETEETIRMINGAKPDVLWVGLGLPKQEKWIFTNKEKLNVPVIVGVGAAFKFLSGKVKRAPDFIGNAGFEWLWRLAREPKTVWKRVIIDGPIFIWLVFKDFLFENNKKI